MKREDAIRKHAKKKFGKCLDCEHVEDYDYCTIRNEVMDNEMFLDFIKIRFCRYFEKAVAK